MVQIFLNDKPVDIAEPQSVDQFVQGLDDAPDSYAIAVNEQFVPRSQYPDVVLQPGDRVELLVPMQGG